MRLLIALLATALAMPAIADAVEDVRQAEIGFAKAFADRDKAKFFSYVAEDAVFLGGLTTSNGKQQVIERWSRFFSGPEAPFSWAPERVSVSADGTLGLSTGPVHDPQGNHIGDYLSTWRKQSDGTWKVLFDSSGPGPAAALPAEEGDITVGEAKVHFRKTGHGPLTIIAPLDFVLHPFLRQLANFATVITYDVRGRGRSPKVENPETLSIEQDVRDLETVRAHFKVEKFIPIGYSYLGKMVVIYAAAYPTRVQRLVQLAPSANRDGATGVSDEDLKKVAMPVLTIHGTKDRNAPYEGGRDWAKTLPDARLVTIEGAAHAMWLDDPAATFAAIRQFLRGEWPLGSADVK